MAGALFSASAFGPKFYIILWKSQRLILLSMGILLILSKIEIHKISLVIGILLGTLHLGIFWLMAIISFGIGFSSFFLLAITLN